MNETKDDSHNYCVYVHVNKINQKKYVGITKRKPQTRWRNGQGYRGQSFFRAIQKYGWDNFDHIILEENLTLIEAAEKEIYYIDKYDSYRNGYNYTQGGESTPIHYNPIICINTKKIFQNISQASEEYGVSYDNMSAHILNKKALLIKENDEEKYYCFDYFKENEEYSLFNYYYKNNNKSIICIETEEIFWNAKEVGIKMPVCTNKVSCVCNHTRPSTNGFHFLYIKEYVEQGLINVDYKTKEKKIICITTGEIFNSIAEGSRKYGIKLSGIHSNLKNKLRYYGYIDNIPLVWQYYDEYLINPKEQNDAYKKIVHCITNDLYFRSVTDASEYFGVYKSDIYACCTGHRNFAGKDSLGNKLKFEYYILTSESNIEFARKGNN